MHIRQGYPPYTLGIKEGVFIKDVTGSPYVGQVRSWWSLDTGSLTDPFLEAGHFR